MLPREPHQTQSEKTVDRHEALKFIYFAAGWLTLNIIFDPVELHLQFAISGMLHHFIFVHH